MKKLLRFLFVAVVGLSVLSCYDDSALREAIDKHEQMLMDLQDRCAEMNADIESLHTLIAAVQNADYITSITPITEGGKEVGYTIVFAKYGTVTIKNGADGAKGEDGAPSDAVPVIGAKQDTDGVYYWTVDGEWLTDDAGNKVPASGKDGADGEKGDQGAPGAPGVDGVTPELKIEQDYWYVSYDGGKTWTQLGRATGEDGKDGANGGDSIFKDVYEKDGYVYFVLSDGTTYKVPMTATAAPAALDITFDVEQGVAMVPDATYKVNYTVVGGDDRTIVRSVIADAAVYAFVKPETATTGSIFIYVESWFDGPDDPYRDEPIDSDFGDLDMTEEEFYHSMLSVLVTVSDGKNNVICKALNITEGVISSVDEAYLVDAAAGTFTAKVKTNAEYEVSVPQAASWLSLAPKTKAEVRVDDITFAVQANETDKFRSTPVHLINNTGAVLESFTVVQRSAIAGEEVKFADEAVKKACVAAFDMNLDNVFTYEEAATVKDLSPLKMPLEAVSFDELEHFSSITYIPAGMFAGCTDLKSVTIPENVLYVGYIPYDEDGYYPESSSDNGVFEGCRSLTSVVIPSGVKGLRTHRLFADCAALTSVELPEFDEIGNHMFAGCSSLEYEIPASVTYIGSYAFYGTRIKSVVLPKDIDYVTEYCFANCRELAEVVLHDKVECISYYAFDGCTSLKTIVLPESLRSIESGAFTNSGLEGSLDIPASVENIEWEAFWNCQNLAEVHMLSETPCYVSDNAFGMNTVIYVPEGCYQAYKNEWKGSFNWAEKSVGICGSFTDWEWDILMTDNGEGWYVAQLYVEAGSEFKFRLDGMWNTDFGISWEKDNVVYPGELYDLERGASNIVVPVSGEITVYLSDDFTQFKYEAESAAALYFNDFDREEATKSYGASGASWPYLDQFTGWMNHSGEGSADVEYAYAAMSARANSFSNASYSDYPGSGLNNLFFGNNAYFAVQNIALNGAADLALTFGTEKYSPDNGSVFTNSEFHIWLSKDGGDKWVELTDYTFAGGTTEGRWNVASANFTVPSGTETLSICMKTDVASSYRLDDLKLEVAATEGTYVDFSNAVEKDFTASEENPSTGAPSHLVKATVAEFIAAAESADVWYELTGEITSIVEGNAYGNLYINDGTGEVYIYGLTNGWVGSNDKSFESIGLEVGDIVTLGTLRGSYNGQPQGGGSKVPAYYISHVEAGSGEVEPEPEPEDTTVMTVSVAEFNAKPVSTSVLYRLTGTVGGPINTKYGNFDLIDETGKVYVYGISNWSDYSATFAEGGTVTVVGQRGDYNGTIEVLEGYIESYTAPAGGGDDSGETPEDPVTPEGKTLTLTNEEICKMMTSSSSSYVDYTIESASGLWEVNASQLSSNTFLQCRGKKGAYIKTPLFENDIKSVTIHFSEAKTVYANNVYCAFPSTWTVPTADAAYPEDGNVGRAVTDGSYSLTIPVDAGNNQVYISIIGTYAYYLDHIDVAF